MRSLDWRWCPECKAWLKERTGGEACGTCMSKVEIKMRESPKSAGHMRVCCKLAVRSKKHCVCAELWTCEFHGETHIGTHD